MRRADLEHLIRAAAAVSGEDDIVVVGSQAVLASFPEAPAELLVSVEADVYPRDRPERAVDIDGAIGEGSIFFDTFGYYAHGVGPETAKAPAGWEDRLVLVRNENTRGAAGWCLEPHDLVLAKCVAGREKDRAFAAAALRHGLVDGEQLLRGLPLLPVDEATRQHVAQVVRGAIAEAGRG